jgi:hypothetical protein
VTSTSKLFNSALCGLLLAMGALVNGCQSPSSNTVVIRSEGHSAGASSQVNIINSGLDSDMQIQDDPADTYVFYEGEILLGVVTIQSCVDAKQSYEYRWSWKDADGIQIDSGGGSNAWIAGWVNALDVKQLSGRSPRPGAVEGKFELRYGTN